MNETLETTMSLKLSTAERDMIRQVAAHRSDELSALAGGQPVHVSDSALIRWLCAERARAIGIIAGSAPSATRPASPTVDMGALRGALEKAVESGRTARSIATEAGVDQAVISRFRKGGRMPESAAQKLAQVLGVR